ncbi:hypothetical protein B0J13DRAFT_597650 [Dactylonectria estremocensis]|uniref:5'-3' exoribonuclease 2 n=1 Tax=Dactylonectria estremocensis TaxID=1079267 RepID=A0A9P9ECZ0_9HYPO|nr:hypothetical protein B0J13DRAFT_597650 [Dactylonectria estremocensis]
MGIPAAFRWLSNKYPKIISPVIEDQPITMEDGSTIPVDTTRPNPNGEELDNLYLDMNGIVHPCSHPEDRPAPTDEEEMMLEVFRYTDRVVNMVRPRKILMIAVDGVAPRAKMNQQRSRRFRSAQEATEKEADKQELIKLLKQQNGGTLPAENMESVTKKAFDSNSITPGTPFMDILALSLRYWCQYKLNTDPGWAKLKVIISDATVPGEGEHKIMDFVRSQRASPDHDPNTRHVIYGLDADLIMLGLATHEPHFRVLREDVFFQDSKARTCKLCGQKGHEARNCRGEAKAKEGEHDEKDNAVALKPFIWLHVSVLREYLAAELAVPNLPFRFDLERVIDDWIFMCCFVGNDFLPHLPALEIREHGIDVLTTIWKDNLPIMGGYVTKDGHIDLERAQCILDGLAKQEDAIFKRRKEQEDRREANFKRRKLYENNGRGGRQGGPSAPRKNGHENPSAGLPLYPIASYPAPTAPALTHDMIVNRSTAADANVANKSAASVLKAQLQAQKSLSDAPKADPQTPASALGKRKAPSAEENNSAAATDSPGTATPTASTEEGPIDEVRLWEDGYQDRYYEKKFHKDPKDIEFRHSVGRAYVEGLAWVLLYYFQGCPSWEWYYPYHYAPFAADFKDLSKMQINFEKGRTSKPFEQLMSVLPAASRHALPEVFHDLMLNPDSSIIDFYPEDFEIDLNGKKFAWQGVALLPFIDMPRLLSAVQSKYPLLSPEDSARNEVGDVVLIFSDGHESLYDDVSTKFYSKRQGEPKFKLNPKNSDGLSGKVEKQEGYVPHGALKYPLERKALPDLEYDRSLVVNYEIPQTSNTHKSMLLRGAQLPRPALTHSDIEVIRGKANRSGRSYGGAPLGQHGQPIHYGSRGGHGGNQFGRQQNGYGRQGGQGGHYPPHAPGVGPPPPGAAGFGIGLPPPPPPAHYYNGQQQDGPRGGPQGYNGNSWGRGQPPPHNPGGQQHGPGGHAYNNNRNRDYRGNYRGARDRRKWDTRTGRCHSRLSRECLKYLLACSWVGNARGLPHRAGTSGQSLQQDDILHVTRATLVELGNSTISNVLDSLLSLLEDLARPYTAVASHPSHVLHSELFILALIADCCSAHWASLTLESNASPDQAPTPPPLDEVLVSRLFDALKHLLEPIPDSYILPAQTLLDQVSTRNVAIPRSDDSSSTTGDEGSLDDDRLGAHLAEMDAYVKTVIEYVTASSWDVAFDYFRNVVYNIRTTTVAQSNPTTSGSFQDAEKAALVVLRLLSFFWVDGPRLGQVIQEICSSFLHFRKPYQNTIAVVTPLLITRWLDRFPREFVELHLLHRRLDGGADTLFDMTHAATDNGKRKTLLYPLQTTLLFLLPDVFEVASNMREAKSGSMVKKVSFLDGLRKALRNRNEQAGHCLVSLLRAARHFDAESDSALVSYALDVQDEVRDAVFRRIPASEPSLFEQDMMTAAFVSLAHLNLDGVSTLVETCISSSAPHSFKLAVVQGCSYFAQQPYALRYHVLFDTAVPFMRSQLETEGAKSTGMPIQGGFEGMEMVCSILQFLDVSPAQMLLDLSGDDPNKTFFKSFLLCVLSAEPSVRRLATGVADRLLTSHVETYRQSDAFQQFGTKPVRGELWSRSSKVLLGLCERIALNKDDQGLIALQEYLKARLLLLKHMPELAEIPEETPDVVSASSKLETTLLISLCSANIDTCQLVTSCIGLFFQECSIVDKHAESAKSSASVLRNGEVFQEIASRAFRFTGLVAFQKRVRGLLRRMQFPTTGILNAWETAFDRWIHLAKDVSTSTIDAVDEKVLSEWRNYSGFLASLGGICTADQAIILEEPALGGLRWIDRISSEHYEEPLLTRYLRLSIQLLACANVRVREAMRDVLSSEVSPALYHPLFKALESELEVLFTGALAPVDKGQDSEVVFAEQAASLLKALVERLESPSDLGAASSVHLGALTLNFAKFLDGVSDTPNTLRVKIRVCHLCEVVTKRKEHLNLRDDVRIRNQLLEYIFGWIARPRSPRPDLIGIGPRQDDMSRVQKDLDKACLKSLADLTFRLPLQPSDSHTDAGMSEMKSQMFHTYFNRFLSLLNHEPSDSGRSDPTLGVTIRDEMISNSDLAITILSNLLSANIDVGLKHSLNIGYHDNVEIRTAFVKVLYNILIQGTEFSNLTDSAVSEKYEELLELLTSDLSLAMSMSVACPSTDVDELTICLLTVFEQRGLIFELLEALVKQEIEDTENESELLRRSCVATKTLSVYAKWKGSSYLRATLQKVLERLMLTSKDLDLELDPARVSTTEELQKNALQLRIVAKVFIDDICASSSSMPPAFRKICNIISNAVVSRFPDAKYTAVGAFIFLRFFCPAIVAPEVEGLVTAAPSKEMRRGLLLIAKVIQNLANNVLFGAKEPYMFPLNDFLTQNIYHVTTFLREISVAPQQLEIQKSTESFDFGSCVALHRFLYDHWDHVRQTLVSRERKEYMRSSGDVARVRSPVLEPLRNLIANLGPPPLAVSWNRPQVSANSPPLYSRFQNFMLRNAFRSTESFLTARAVYDGGESKDGLSIICIILRHIETESIDYDTLIYCYLKIASRLWHRPFGLLIDATCYNGRNEPQDDLFKKLELLTPSELSCNLTRIYVYNMNSAFKRCFRRLLRVCTKNENGVFNPKNVEYHLIGSLQDLQAHFHLSQLHLPKETISVVTDTRYVFQPITRLSKSKGKIEVIIKVGSQFVQVTTTKKQEIFAGFRLGTTVNDIFRLGEVDEAPTSIQTEDDSAFGLRADNGKIVMYFTSPKKSDVLQTIRGAKAKHGKDSRTQKSVERLIRPQDVPGTLLNLALANLSSPDHVLRLSSYNLLGALCKAFKFSSASRLVCTKDVSVPLDPMRFIVSMSKELAHTEPQLTSDFLTEFFVGWESFPDEQKPLSLAYMAPWLPGLRTNILAHEMDGEKGREKVAVLFRKLIDITVQDHALVYSLEQSVWPKIIQDEILLEIFLDELLKTAMSYGIHEEPLEVISSIVVGIGTVTLRGKILSRLRKALNRSSLRPTKYLPDNAVWSEICILLQFCLSLSFDSGVQSQLFLPEIFHVVTMLANTGSQDVRLLVYRLLVNSVHAVCTSFDLDDAKSSKLRASLDFLCDPRSDIFSAPPAFVRDGASVSTSQEAGPALSATENLAAALFEICSVAAPTIDLSNAWRSRWMSLVASTAFQNNPAIQPRAFSVMGCLAREEVDDDLLYQVLVALRNSVGRFGEDHNSEMLVSIVTSLSKMMAKLPSASRYGLQLFWLAMSLLRLVPANLFNCAALFLEAVLANISTGEDVRGAKMVPLLLQGRVPLDEAALPLEDVYGIHFTQDTFEFAVCACLARGLTDTVTRQTAMRVLSAFLEMSSDPTTSIKDVPEGSAYLALLLARAVGHEELKDSLWSAGINPGDVDTVLKSRELPDIAAIQDKNLLLMTAIELVDFQYLEDTVQTRSLQWLNELAIKRPSVVVHLSGAIRSLLDDILLHGQNSTTLGAAHILLRTLSSNRQLSRAVNSVTLLTETLENMGFGGLWRSCSLGSMDDINRDCLELTEKLIELIII